MGAVQTISTKKKIDALLILNSSGWYLLIHSIIPSVDFKKVEQAVPTHQPIVKKGLKL